ncbi:2_t:CDS:2 [Cetraspora pellucida]|uniref:2_t:CDS:1 n=1 Tax=Cetraspora pellucida TaxID=1433469 RepID=A0ACA9KMM6_9GLOM|nr:2_t:CDS:2 [Cetraspora pellucida]
MQLYPTKAKYSVGDQKHIAYHYDIWNKNNAKRTMNRERFYYLYINNCIFRRSYGTCGLDFCSNNSLECELPGHWITFFKRLFLAFLTWKVFSYMEDVEDIFLHGRRERHFLTWKNMENYGSLFSDRSFSERLFTHFQLFQIHRHD